MKAFLASITPQILDILTPLFLAALGWLSYRAAGWIKAYTQNAKLQGVLLRLNDAVITAVSSLEQTVVVAAKNAASDGQLTKEDGLAVRNAAIAEVKAHLGPRGIAELRAILGVQDDGLDSFLASRVEGQVLLLPVKSQVAPCDGVPLGSQPVDLHIVQPGAPLASTTPTPVTKENPTGGQFGGGK